MTPSYVTIGHVSKDLRPDGSGVAGGTALYASLAASRLGYEAGLVTTLAAADGWLLGEALAAGVSCVGGVSAATTTFENRYQGEARRQVLHAVAAPLDQRDVPAAWRQAAIVHLGPVAQELPSDAQWPALFHSSLIGVTPQGWMRRWDAGGAVEAIPWAGADRLLPHCHVLVMSREDAGGDWALLEAYARLAPLTVITAGGDEALILERGRAIARVPALAARPVDLTGAGDVFAAGFLVGYHETGDPLRAARLGHAAAAAAIEAEGTRGIAERAVVEARLEAAEGAQRAG